MSFSSFEAGSGTSAGAAIYPLRTLVRDVIERIIQLELSRLLDRADSTADRDTQSEQGKEVGEIVARDISDGDLDSWLFSNDSPLLLQNIPGHVLDPMASLRAISERIDGPGHILSLTNSEMGSVSASHRAMEFRLRVKNFAELNAERILGTPRRRGTPKGKTRTHYVWLISPDRDISNHDFKELVLEIIRRRWPGARVLGYIHRDTNNTHLHLWLSAEQTSRRKIYAGEVKQADGKVVDKFRDIDEEVALAFSQHFNDPSVYKEHMAKKQEWNRWRERFEEALKNGERPPVMPHRARHEFDYVGEKVAVARREQIEEPSSYSARGKAPPMPRTKSLMGALELWGKTIHLQARIAYRRELLESLNAWQYLIEHPVEGVREHFERQLSEAERDYQAHQKAFDKTLENRACKNYPELKYALHNSKQSAEMREIARLTYDTELLRYVHSYALLDKAAGREELSREIGERWRDQIIARLDVHELAEQLERVARINGSSTISSQTGDNLGANRSLFNSDQQIVRGWLYGDWTIQQMRGSLACIENDSTKYHASRYVKVREYAEAAKEILEDYRRGAERLITRPALEDVHVSRINFLLEREMLKLDQKTRAFLQEIVVIVADNQKPTLKKFERLIEQSLLTNDAVKKPDSRTSITQDDLNTLSPFDERWMGKLVGVTKLKELEALALAMRGTDEGKFVETAEAARESHNLLDLARVIRVAQEQANDPQIIKLSLSEQRSFDKHYQFISQQLDRRDIDWTATQIDRIGEFAHCLSPQDKKSLSRTLERAQLHLEKEQRREELEKVREHLDLVAQFFVRKIYQTEGVNSLRDAEGLDERVETLAARYLQVIVDQGRTPQQLGLNEQGLRAKARVTFSVNVERIEQEEREIDNLSKLEAQKILAEQLSAVNTARRERFEAHWYFMKWNYQTMDEHTPGRISLADAKLEYAEQESLGKRGDLALMIIREEARENIIRTIIEEYNCLRSIEEQSRNEALSLCAQYHEKLSSHQEKGLSVRGPKFTPGDFEKLDEHAAETRSVEVSELISRIEKAEFGLSHATRRSLGRALAAEVGQHNEVSLAAQYDTPLDLSKHPYLSPQLHAELSQASHRHREARDSEKSRALIYSRSLRDRADELIAKCVESTGDNVRPLLMPREANIIFPSFQAMDAHARYMWEEKLKRAQVLDADINKKSPSDPNYHKAHPNLFEWATKTRSPVAHTLGNTYERSLGEKTIVSYREAQQMVKERFQERARNLTTEYHSRR